MPRGVRTKRASPRILRRRARALDTAGCVSPKRVAAGVTPFSCCTASNTRSRLRSMSWTFITVIHIMNDIDLTNGPAGAYARRFHIGGANEKDRLARRLPGAGAPRRPGAGNDAAGGERFRREHPVREEPDALHP